MALRSLPISAGEVAISGGEISEDDPTLRVLNGAVARAVEVCAAFLMRLPPPRTLSSARPFHIRQPTRARRASTPRRPSSSQLCARGRRIPPRNPPRDRPSRAARPCCSRASSSANFSGRGSRRPGSCRWCGADSPVMARARRRGHRPPWGRRLRRGLRYAPPCCAGRGAISAADLGGRSRRAISALIRRYAAGDAAAMALAAVASVLPPNAPLWIVGNNDEGSCCRVWWWWWLVLSVSRQQQRQASTATRPCCRRCMPGAPASPPAMEPSSSAVFGPIPPRESPRGAVAHLAGAAVRRCSFQPRRSTANPPRKSPRIS